MLFQVLRAEFLRERNDPFGDITAREQPHVGIDEEVVNHFYSGLAARVHHFHVRHEIWIDAKKDKEIVKYVLWVPSSYSRNRIFIWLRSK
jgi:hypothetical protein